MMAFLQAALLLSLSISYGVCTATYRPKPQVADKPHILFMLVDDWGWAMLATTVILQLVKLTLPTLTA